MGDIESNLRELYSRFSSGNLPGVLELCTDDIVFELPGNNRLPKRCTKETFGPGLIATVMQLSGGTFREDVVDIMAGESHGAAYLLHSLTRDGKPIEYKTLHLWGVMGDRFCSWRELPEDLYAFDAAWS
jgi:hypothetical protein